MTRFFETEPSFPAPSTLSTTWRCVDGDPLCDQGPAGDRSCDFAIGVCVNGDELAGTPTGVARVVVRNKPPRSPRHDPELAALQTGIDALGLPTPSQSLCTPDTVTVRVRRQGSGKAGKRTVMLEAVSWPHPVTGRVRRERNRLRLVCEDLGFSGTFDVIAHDIFSPSCATETCHGGDLPQGDMSLESTWAYAGLVNVVPQNPVAAAGGMKLVDPGNPGNSFLMRKLCGPDPGDPALRPEACAGHNLVHVHYHGPGSTSSDEGHPMPPTGNLSDAQTTLIHAWISAGAPPTGWVP